MRAMTTEEARDVIRCAIEKAGSQKAFADANGLSTAYVSDSLNVVPPSDKILKAVGLERFYAYRKAGASDGAQG